jgi:glycosyltransferase involved in cell wall biosynthesis
MGKRPKVTIAIVTYNRAHFLKHTINSCLRQSFADYELLILNNASTDNTADVINTFKDKRIKHILNKKNIGSINNINKAFGLAKGDYLLIVHDDDMMKPDMVRRQVEILDRQKPFQFVRRYHL